MSPIRTALRRLANGSWYRLEYRLAYNRRLYKWLKVCIDVDTYRHYQIAAKNDLTALLANPTPNYDALVSAYSRLLLQ